MFLDLIAGARPNFVKLAPIIRAVEEAAAEGQDISYRFIHTGQHSSDAMSTTMLRDLQMPAPHIELGCTGETRGSMLASVVREYDAVLRAAVPNCTLVVGDVTSTLGAALAAKAANVPVAHVEAGLRSGDRTMPEEINRAATDAVADIHFTTSRSAGTHLLREGVAQDRIHFVGNTMADALLQTLPAPMRSNSTMESIAQGKEYALLTLHRPVNVDNKAILRQWILAVAQVCNHMQILFPVHPRTASQLPSTLPNNVTVLAPASYATFLSLEYSASLIITDSGGVSEEATILWKPCVTLRATTERPETVDIGTNVLCPTPEDLAYAVAQAIAKATKAKATPELWDGLASQRIVNALLNQQFVG